MHYLTKRAQNFFKLWITYNEMWISAFKHVYKSVQPLVIKLKKEKFFYDNRLLLIRPLTCAIAIKKRKNKDYLTFDEIAPKQKTEPPKLLTTYFQDGSY